MRVFCEVTVSYSPFMWSLSLRWVGRWVLLVLQLKFTDLRHERIFLLPLSRQTASEIAFKLIQLMNFGLKLARVDLIRLQFERLIMFLHFGHGPIEFFRLYLICFLFITNPNKHSKTNLTLHQIWRNFLLIIKRAAFDLLTLACTGKKKNGGGSVRSRSRTWASPAAQPSGCGHGTWTIAGIYASDGPESQNRGAIGSGKKIQAFGVGSAIKNCRDLSSNGCKQETSSKYKFLRVQYCFISSWEISLEITFPWDLPLRLRTPKHRSSGSSCEGLPHFNAISLPALPVWFLLEFWECEVPEAVNCAFIWVNPIQVHLGVVWQSYFRTGCLDLMSKWCLWVCWGRRGRYWGS